jgi:hypothetical protein
MRPTSPKGGKEGGRGNKGYLHCSDARQRGPLGREGAGELIVMQQPAPLAEIRPSKRKPRVKSTVATVRLWHGADLHLSLAQVGGPA